MPITHTKAIPDRVGMPVYFRDKQGKLCQFLATSDVLDNIEIAVADCRSQVIEELITTKEAYKHCPVFAVIIGGKA